MCEMTESRIVLFSMFNLPFSINVTLNESLTSTGIEYSSQNIKSYVNLQIIVRNFKIIKFLFSFN